MWELAHNHYELINIVQRNFNVLIMLQLDYETNNSFKKEPKDVGQLMGTRVGPITTHLKEKNISCHILPICLHAWFGCDLHHHFLYVK